MVTAAVQPADSSTVTTLGDTQALPRVIDVDPGEPAPVTMALPTAALLAPRRDRWATG